MAKELQYRRGTTAMLDNAVGAFAEVQVNVNTKELRVFDGETPGGFSLARKPDDTIEDLVVSTEPSRGPGAIWQAGPSTYVEAEETATDYDLITGQGVKLYLQRDAVGATALAGSGIEFTAKASVPATAKRDAAADLNRMLRDETTNVIMVPSGAMRLDAKVEYTQIRKDISIIGQGMRQSVFELHHLEEGFNLEVPLDARHQFTIEYKDFGAHRILAEPWAPSGALAELRYHTLRIARSKDAVMRRVIQTGNIGFGLSMFDGLNALIEECESGNAAALLSGTDGIHSAHGKNGKVLKCFVHDVGDDGISFGSYKIDPALGRFTTEDVFCQGNRLQDIKGSGVKLYGNVNGANVLYNFMRRCEQGAVQTRDVGNPETPAYDQHLRNVLIEGNIADECIGPEGTPTGFFFQRFQYDHNTNVIHENITIRRNKMRGCKTFFTSTANPATDIKRVSNITIDENEFIDADVAAQGGSHYGMLIRNISGYLKIRKNELRNIIGSGVLIDDVGTLNWTKLDVFEFSKNTLDGWNYFTGVNTAIGLRVSPSNLTVNISGNAIIRQNPDGLLANAISLPTINPNSIYQDNSVEGSVAIATSYRTTDPRTAATVPTAGTYIAGEHIRSTANTGPSGWQCRVSGTFGTLTGVTASGIVGERKITVNTLDTIQRGQRIAVTGLPGGSATILRIEGLVLIINVAVSSTFTDEVVSYSAPSIKALADFP